MLEFMAVSVGFVLISDQFNKHLLQISYEPGSILVPGDPRRRKNNFGNFVRNCPCQSPSPFTPENLLSSLNKIRYLGTYVTSRLEFRVVPLLFLMISCSFWLTHSLGASHWATVCNICQWSILIANALVHSFCKYLLCMFYVPDTVLGTENSSEKPRLVLH